MKKILYILGGISIAVIIATALAALALRSVGDYVVGPTEHVAKSTNHQSVTDWEIAEEQKWRNISPLPIGEFQGYIETSVIHGNLYPVIGDTIYGYYYKERFHFCRNNIEEMCCDTCEYTAYFIVP